MATTEPCRMRFSGLLTAVDLQLQTEAVAMALAFVPRLLVDCSGMTGYEPVARERFVAFLRAHAAHLQCVAVVVDRPMYRVILAAMAVAVPFPMRAFDTSADANAWLLEQPDKKSAVSATL